MILIFPYDIAIGSGFKIYIKRSRFLSHFLNMGIIFLIRFYLFFDNNHRC